MAANSSSLLLISLWLLQLVSIDSFLSIAHQGSKLCPSKTQQAHANQRQHESLLWAAPKARRSSSSSSLKNKNNRKVKLKTKRRSEPTKDNSKDAKPFQGTKKQKRVKTPPPWQVMAQKDVSQNIIAEQERRSKQQTTSRYEQPKNTGRATLSTAFLSGPESHFLQWKRFPPSTRIGELRFAASMADQLQLPESFGVPEVAFLGRSNVGKSSLLNRLTGGVDGDRARVGKTPGATAAVNWYTVLDQRTKQGQQEKPLLSWVDLPGFGYAKLSKTLQENIQAAAEHYLLERRELALGVLLVDIRREPSDDDRGVLAALYDMGLPITVVATKVDKLSKTEREKQLKVIQQGLGLAEGQPLCVSSVTGEGCKLLWKVILDACETAVEEFREKYVDEESQMSGPDYKEIAFEDDDDMAYEQGYDWIHGETFEEAFEEDDGYDA